MLHIHTATSARPDRVLSTGVWQPYPLGANPIAVAQQTVHSFLRFVRPEGPQVANQMNGAAMQPEEIAMLAQRVATAAAQGVKFRRSLDSRIVKAANLILAGKSFVIRSAGRAAVVRASSPGSWIARYNSNPASYAIR
jgi:hypothetical protein